MSETLKFPSPSSPPSTTGRRIAWRDSSGNVHYDFVDVIGSTRAVTNSTGSVCFSADYSPEACPERSRRGQENDFTTSCTPTYKFAGYEFDSETGNYYAMARYYDPSLGRFLTADPLGGYPANPQSLNRYTYVLNNPETFTDPLGLKNTFTCNGLLGCSATVQVMSGPLQTFDISNVFGQGSLTGLTGVGVGGPLTPIGIGHGFGGGGRGGSNKLLANLPLAPPQTPCPPVPPHPASASVSANIQQVQAWQNTVVVSPDPNVTRGEYDAVDALWLRNVCCSGAAWDYKSILSSYDAFGNFNYGATGAALGIPESVLLRGAGLAKWLDLKGVDEFGNPLGGFPYGNEPDKQQEIEQGIEYFKNNCAGGG